MRYLVIVIFFAFFFSCNSNMQEEEKTNQENQDPILAPYFSIVDALTNDNFDEAREQGKILSKANSDNGVKLALVRMGTLINESSSLFDQRTILEQLGMVIPLYLEQSIMNDYPIYKFKCKNEFNDKEVVWFSLSNNSKNPFIGDNTNDCVELIEIIKPVIKK